MSPSHISLAAETFDPWKVQAVSRHLADHPLLQIDALIEPSKRQQGRKLVRSHSDVATAGTSLSDAPKSAPEPQKRR